MAAVDSLLRLMMVRSADMLVVTAGKVPTMRRAGETSQLSMPALQAGLVTVFADEVLAEDDRDASSLTAGEKLETTYVSEDGAAFTATIEVRETGARLTFRPDAGKPTTAPSISATSSARSLTPAAPTTQNANTPTLHPVQPADGDASAAALHESTAVVGSSSGDPVAARSPRYLAMLQASPEDPARLAALAPVFERAHYENASDIVLSVGHPPRLRVNGEFLGLSGPVCTDGHILAIARSSLRIDHLRELDERGSMDLSFMPSPQSRFRVNVFRQLAGLAAVLRPIREDIPTLRQLNLPNDLHELAAHPHGLVLICGPTGSGKSTTLVALLEHVNEHRARHIVTLEDPIEYRYRSKRSLVHQRELGTHVDSFDSGLRAALRENPDIILVGEMRDRATIAAALTAAETGHLVLSTLHSSHSAMTVDRIIDVFPEHQQRQIRLQLSNVLRAVVTQFLLPVQMRRAHGPTRVPAFEKMVMTPAIAHLIRDNKVHQMSSHILTGREHGMVPLERTLAQLIVNGQITRQAACTVTMEQDLLAEMIHNLRRSM